MRQLVYNHLAGTAAGMYGIRRLQVGRCGELTEGLTSRPTVAGVIARDLQMTPDSDVIGAVPARTSGVSAHRDDFLMPACAERGLVRTAMFHAPADVPRAGRLR